MHSDNFVTPSFLDHYLKMDPLRECSERVCLDWQQGTCKLGESCAFRHDVNIHPHDVERFLILSLLLGFFS